MSLIIFLIKDKPRPEEFLVEKYGLIKFSTSPSNPGPLSKKDSKIILSSLINEISIIGFVDLFRASIEFYTYYMDKI